jgi:hypothetical protein
MKEKVPFVNFAINTAAFPNIYTRFVAPAAGLTLPTDAKFFKVV